MLWFCVLSAFGFFSVAFGFLLRASPIQVNLIALSLSSVQIVSCISHVARYAPSPTFNLSSKTISKSNKANL